MVEEKQLEVIAHNIWGVGGSVGLFPGAKLPLRSTIVRLSDGRLLIHSPVAFSADVVAAIHKLGEVAYLVAPNLFHHLFLEAAQKHFPNANTLGPAFLTKKVKSLHVDFTVTTSLPTDLAFDFEHVQIRGAPAFSEFVLLHRPSKSLLVGDYFFNIRSCQGVLTPIVLRLTGTWQKVSQSKLWRLMSRDREEMKASAQEVLSLDYQRVIVCHGDVVEQGRDFTRHALGWLLDA